MSDIKRKGTVKRAPGGGGGGAKPKKNISIVKQGMKQLYPEKDSFVPVSDIILVPGLGAHPTECWETKNFKWPTDALAKDFPHSRILLYMYQSAWLGALKVEQQIFNLAMGLLVAIDAHRDKKHARRPIVFIGHSMGGLVIAKAVTIADSHRKEFPLVFEAISAAIFFGTPFKGAAAAPVASMYANIAEKLGQTKPSELLDFMTPGNPQLRELVDDFTHLVGKVSPSISVTCFYEERDTDLSGLAKLPSVFGKITLPSALAKFVTQESATLEISFKLGLAANHRDLVKFESAHDFQFVRGILRRHISDAPSMVRKRMNDVQGVDPDLTKKIDNAFDAPFIAGKRKAVAKTFPPSPWITKETEYIEWLAESDDGEDSETTKPTDCLWVRAHEGRGKTSASLAVIDDIEKRQAAERDQDPMLLAYFFCDQTPDFCSAEDVLKSLLRQLIGQQETLAPYAKAFIKKSKDDKAQAQITVENLWQVLQDMLTDAFIGRKVVFVLNNLHVLPENSASTTKLMGFLHAEMSDMSETGSRSVVTRWFITSRDVHNVGKALGMNQIRLVDLEDEKYESQVHIALRKIAKSKVESLVVEKKYSKALAYFVSSIIGKRAQNTQWIEISCVQLYELPAKASDLKVRRVLETMPQDLRDLLNNAWRQAFRATGDDIDTVQELLRALVLTYENPTAQELGILAGLGVNEVESEELHRLIEMCKPLLVTDAEGNVSFMNAVVKSHLLQNAEELLDMSEEEVKLQHGLLALRCLEHVKEVFGVDGDLEIDKETDSESESDEEDSDEGEDEEDEEEEDGEEGEDGEEEDEAREDEEDESEGAYGAERPPGPAMEYAVKHWLRHASKATFGMAENLGSEHEDFWMPESRMRRRWLTQFYGLTSSLESVFWLSNVKKWTAVHVASAFGFQDLVAALIRNGHEGEIAKRDTGEYAPLHLAAHFGRTKVAQELLYRGAPINEAVDTEEHETPLHMAAENGHVAVMQLLILRGADPNATSPGIGPVVNSAISSGNRAAVELLVERGVTLTMSCEGDGSSDVEPPLTRAALLSDLSMFEYLVTQYADQLPADEYSKALVKSAGAGRVDVVHKLIEFSHDGAYFQKALDAAADAGSWDVAKVLLSTRTGLNCNNLFHKAATIHGDQDDMLGAAWTYANGAISRDTVNRALYDATDREKAKTVKLLLGEPYRADPNATGEEYGNALTAAAYDGTHQIVDMLLEAGADLHAPAGWPLQTAAARDHGDIVAQFLARGADVNAVTRDTHFPAGTALQGACEGGKADMVRLLLEHGADPNLGGGDDGPPVIAATRFGQDEILRLLVAHGADVNARCDGDDGDDASTPLINAAGRNMDGASLRLLLDHGADLDGADATGNTALMRACEVDHAEAARVLLAHGADILRENHLGRNALQVALEYGADDCLELLVTQTSALLAALRVAVDRGDRAVTALVRGVAARNQRLDYDGDAAAVASSYPFAPDDAGRADEEQEQHRYRQPDASDRPSPRENEDLGYGMQEPRPPHPFQPAFAQAEDTIPQFGAQAGPGWQHWAETPEPPLPYRPAAPPTSPPPRASVQPSPFPSALAIRRKPTPSAAQPSAHPELSPSPSLSPAPASGGGYFAARATREPGPPQPAPVAGARKPYLPYDPRGAAAAPSSPSPPESSFERFPGGPPPALAPKPAAYAAAAAAAAGGAGYRGSSGGQTPPLPYRAPPPPPWARDTGYDDPRHGTAG